MGGVISSEADAADNILRTETLTSSDIENSESYKASSIGLSASLSGIGAKDGAGAAPTADEDGRADVTGTDNTVAGLKTGIGTLSAGAPVALGASGSQDGTTRSAIAAGTIEITPGADGTVDAASLATANTISRNTDSANDGALVQEFDDAKRAEIEEGFAVTRELVVQTAEFFNNRAREEAEKRDEADAAEAARDAAVMRGDTEEAKRQEAIRLAAQADADRLKATYSAGSPTRIIATALTGSASANVTGSFTNLVQGAAVNVIQSLAATEVKRIADSLEEDSNNDMIRDGSTLTSESVRAALQSVVGCAGSAAGGSGSCGSAAVGAAASVVVNYLITEFGAPEAENGEQLSLEEQQARANLVATIIGGISEAAGLDSNAAVIAAQIETENNKEGLSKTDFVPCDPNKPCNAPAFKDWGTSSSAYREEWNLWAARIGCNGNDPQCAAVIARALERYFTPTYSGSKQEAVEAAQHIEDLSGGDPDRGAVLQDMSLQELNDLAEFKRRFNRLSPTAQAAVLEDIQNYDPDNTAKVVLGRIVGAIFGEEDATAAYFALSQGGADFRDLGRGIKDGAIDMATPIGVFLNDIAVVSSVYDERTGQINPYYETPEGKAELAESTNRLATQFDNAGNAIGDAASGLAQLGSDLAPPPWVGPGGIILYVPDQAEVDAYNTRVSRGLTTLKDGSAAVVKGVLEPIANTVDNCMVQVDAEYACGRSIPPVATEVAIAVVTDGAITAIRRSGDAADAVGDAGKIAPAPPRSIDELLPDGKVPTVNQGFDEWFDDLSPEELDTLWNIPAHKKRIENGIRDPGDLHEWCMVCRAPDFKRWGVSIGEIKRFRTSTAELKWIDPDTGVPGSHGRTGSGKFHNELKRIIDNSKTLDEFNNGVRELVKRWRIDPKLLPPFPIGD